MTLITIAINYLHIHSNLYFQIPHMHIATIEKLPLTTTGSPLLIRCKTFLSVTFVIPKDSECHDVYTSLQKLYQPGIFVLLSFFLLF